MSDEYWISTSTHGTSGDRVLHVDEDCRYLQRSGGYRPTSRERHPERDICSECGGEDYQTTAPRVHYEAALDHDEDVVPDGGTPMGPRGKPIPENPDGPLSSIFYK